jgi:lysophospholipase L1-like esterase
MKQKILILLLSWLFIFLSGEIMVRILERFVAIYDIEMAKYATSLKMPSPNPDRGHYHKNNSKAHLMGVDISINSLGLRDREYSLGKPKNVYRIMVLGDSITLGWGVDQRDCYPQQLEEMLRKNVSSKTGVDYEVINTGVGNYNTVQELAYFKDEGYRLNPDMIILGFHINDAEPVPRKTKSFFLNHSHLMVLFWSKMNMIMSRFSPRHNYIDYYNSLYRDSYPGWIRCQNALKELKNYCSNNNKKLLVVLIPELHDLSNAYPFKEAYKKVEDFVKSQSISYLDLYPYFKGRTREELWVSYEDAHPNKTGHEIIARGIYEYLTRKESLK